MKNIYYLLALIAVVFYSCDPLSKTYKDLDANPKSQSITIALSNTYKTQADANVGLAGILNTRYDGYAEGSNASITFPLPATFNIVPDTLFTHVAYTLAASDYVFPSTQLNGATIPANSTPYFSAAGVINYLNYKYPTPAPNQLVALTYLFFDANGTPAAGTLTNDSFLYLNGVWTKVYTVTPAQYASVNRGANNYFIATDLPTLPAYFNLFLKSDPTVMATVKTGDVKYVSYRYLTTVQKVLPLTYDGVNWVAKFTSAFLKFNGTWIPDPTIYITEPVGVNADYSYLKGTTIGSDAARSNLASFGDFNIQSPSSTSYWSDADITSAFIAILLHRIANPVIGVPYKVTYSVFTGSVSATSKTFKFDGTTFVLQ